MWRQNAEQNKLMQVNVLCKILRKFRVKCTANGIVNWNLVLTPQRIEEKKPKFNVEAL